MVTQETGRFWDILGKQPNDAILDLRDPQNRTCDHISIPKGPKISSYDPFSSHFVRISSQIEPNPSQATWEPGFGFLLFFQCPPLPPFAYFGCRNKRGLAANPCVIFGVVTKACQNKRRIAETNFESFAYFGRGVF